MGVPVWSLRGAPVEVVVEGFPWSELPVRGWAAIGDSWAASREHPED